ncbi:MAG: nitroreductase family protein [Chloroflexi bacterium]|nr:nitroreductase family protein [Chloroflexota bacterium]
MPFNKPITAVIQKRFSCRAYLKRPIEDEIQVRLADYLASPQIGPFGSRARFKLVSAIEGDSKVLRGLGTYGFIKDAAGFIVGATRDVEKNLEDFGYLMELIILLATDLGLGTCWLGGTFARSNFAKKISAREDEIIPAVASIGYIAEKKRGVDQKIRNLAGSDRRLPWDKLFFDVEFGTPLSQHAAGDYAVPLEMVRLAPSASNRQPWRIVKDGDTWHFYLRRTPGYRDSKSARLLKLADLQRIDMGIAMSHFELSGQEIGLDGRWKVHEPGINKLDELMEYSLSWVG